MSVDRAKLVHEMGYGVEFTQLGGIGVAELEAARVQATGLSIVADPIPANPAHALVLGTKSSKVQRTLLRMARFVQHAPTVELD